MLKWSEFLLHTMWQSNGQVTPFNIKRSETMTCFWWSAQTAPFLQKTEKAWISLHHVAPISEFEQHPKRRQGADGRTRVWLSVWGQTHKAQRNHYWLSQYVWVYGQLKWWTASQKYLPFLKDCITNFTQTPKNIRSFSTYRWKSGNTMTVWKFSSQSETTVKNEQFSQDSFSNELGTMSGEPGLDVVQSCPITHAAHNRRPSMSHVFSPPGNTPFGLGVVASG